MGKKGKKMPTEARHSYTTAYINTEFSQLALQGQACKINIVMSVAKDKSYLDHRTGHIISAGFVKTSSGKDVLNNNHT